MAAPFGQIWVFHPVQAGGVGFDVQKGRAFVGVNISQAKDARFFVQGNDLRAGQGEGVGAQRRTGREGSQDGGRAPVGRYFLQVFSGGFPIGFGEPP